jgi:hypothetical protein
MTTGKGNKDRSVLAQFCLDLNEHSHILHRDENTAPEVYEPELLSDPAIATQEAFSYGGPDYLCIPSLDITKAMTEVEVKDLYDPEEKDDLPLRKTFREELKTPSFHPVAKIFSLFLAEYDNLRSSFN